MSRKHCVNDEIIKQILNERELTNDDKQKLIHALINIERNARQLESSADGIQQDLKAISVHNDTVKHLKSLSQHLTTLRGTISTHIIQSGNCRGDPVEMDQ